MDGDGPDIINCNLLPYDRLIGQGLLAEIDGMMARDREFDVGDFYEHIFDAIRAAGKLYVVPMSNAIFVFIANKAILDQEGIAIDDAGWTWWDFKETAEKVKRDHNADGRPDRFCIRMFSAPSMRVLTELCYSQTRPRPTNSLLMWQKPTLAIRPAS